jgi:hypothetical protein
MQTPTPTTPEIYEEQTRLDLWKESVGRVFKLTTKSYGIRTVVYTQVKAVTETEVPGDFDVQVACAEIIARVLSSKRAHSSVCKEGTIHHTADSVLLPDGFGEECPAAEFENITTAILAHATGCLDRVMIPDPEEKSAIDIPIDLPHLKLTEMEASLVQDSPFLIKDLYFLTANSVHAAFESINQDLHRASRNNRLTDTADPVYLEQKNEAVSTLREKLRNASLEPTGQRNRTQPAEVCDPIALMQTTPAFPMHANGSHVANGNDAKPSPATGKRSDLALVEIDSIALALLGKPAATQISWQIQNPSTEGAVYRVGQKCGLLEFVRWAHVSGRLATAQESAGKKIRSYFGGYEGTYTGPDKTGVYPVLKPIS